MPSYDLDEQVGFLLRRANQRHRAIFGDEMPVRIPPTQFAALAKLLVEGELSQNLLGRLTAMDSATIAGVVGRLSERAWVTVTRSQLDSRMNMVDLTDEGRVLVTSLLEPAKRISEITLSVIPLEEREETLYNLSLLGRSPSWQGLTRR